MYVFIGDFSTNFRHKFFLFFLKRLLCAFVCPSWFKETGGLHSVRRARAPTSGREEDDGRRQQEERTKEEKKKEKEGKKRGNCFSKSQQRVGQ